MTMLTDLATQVATAQAVTASGTSTDYFAAQLGGWHQDTLMFGVHVDESFVGAGSVDFLIESSSAADFGSDTRTEGGVYGLVAADLPAGRTLPIHLQHAPVSGAARYVRARWVVSGAAFSAGKVTIAMADGATMGDGARHTAGASAFRY